MSIQKGFMKFSGGGIEVGDLRIENRAGEAYLVCGFEGERIQASALKVSDLITLMERVKNLEAEFYLLGNYGDLNGKVCSCKRST